MGSVSATHMQAVIFFFLLCCVPYSSAIDTITRRSWLSDGGKLTIVSATETFELGFFTPNGNSRSGRYIGIWYHGLKEKTIVWVANRDKPLYDTIGVFGIAEDGKLKVLDETGQVYWLSDVETSSSASRVVKLMDSGNLILSDSRSGEIFWESFHNPTDTFLPGMKMDENLRLTSWVSAVDPATGNFTFMLDLEVEGYTVFKDSITTYWRSGRDEMPYPIAYLLSNFSRTITPISNMTLGLPSLNYSNTRLVMKYSGEIQFLNWDNKTGWSPTWRQLEDTCSVSNACGKFGICNMENSLVCKCLPGFQPLSPERWASADFSDGCTRESSICSRYGNDSFLRLKMIRVRNPDERIPGKDEKECRKECLKRCPCEAYLGAHVESRKGAGAPECWIWTDGLNTLQEEFNGGHDLYIRVSLSDIDSKARNCEICGSNVIPYPLSTGPNCGDPLYSSFSCDDTTAQVFFAAPSGNYRITGIHPEKRKFLIKSYNASKCDPPQLNQSLPFSMKSWCNTDPQNITSDMPPKVRNDIEITWEPPEEPICTSLRDCGDWPNSTCSKQDEKKRCLCNTNFQWDGDGLNCTKQAGTDPQQEGVGYPKQEGGSQGKKPSSTVYVVASTIVVSVSLACIITYIAYFRKRKIARSPENRGSTNPAFHSFGSERHVKDLISSSHFKEDDKKGIDVPFFELESILAATDNFSEENKLGRGGFGPVYKGKFPGGKEIAVKRLSSTSGQGLEEFKNEVVLIAKLQHRNLVRLLGYCVKGDEKILLYEYMPNKSLDSFIFDQRLCMLLNWGSRFDIILGIARGLIYLHQDSRLKIIHRDLKTSNILLDVDMNPKISDFGLARIFESKQIEANTNRVVGTYGYMSPEYALNGFFSVKSDVFSFGVVVLEIISGKRNTGFYQSDQALSLLGYAWRLWKEDKVYDLMDHTLSETCNTNEFLRCVNVGLLCVQEDPSDRPTMANAFLMLSSEIASLPVPQQPAFVVRRGLLSVASSSSTNPKTCSNNEITVSLEEGR